MNADERLKQTDDWVEHAKRCVEACEGINPEAVPAMAEAMKAVVDDPLQDFDDYGVPLDTFMVDGDAFRKAQAALSKAGVK
jgi:hypothetical protein